MKKVFAIVLTLLMVAGLLAACGGQADPPAADTPDTPANTPAEPGEPAEPAAEGDTTLTVVLNMDIQEVYEEFFASFEEANPGIKIDLQSIGPAIAEYVQPAIASDTFPDAVSVNSDAYSKQLADEGWLMDLNGTPRATW